MVNGNVVPPPIDDGLLALDQRVHRQPQFRPGWIVMERKTDRNYQFGCELDLGSSRGANWTLLPVRERTASYEQCASSRAGVQIRAWARI
jgi:hypothetical protein